MDEEEHYYSYQEGLDRRSREHLLAFRQVQEQTIGRTAISVLKTAGTRADDWEDSDLGAEDSGT